MHHLVGIYWELEAKKFDIPIPGLPGVIPISVVTPAYSKNAN